ncbi:hypothetical protein CLV63_11068 [Murinocardiopsis flavida]|uniref:Uncharacterized protein n=1 Tax=Murinocardiopsis flavida TaxID=645275 RepID=A0A2P8DHS8_9ACTN|nr:hypothetical protein [Murinocardiopsis flavida]PSK96771.1 hypothetical protein CLV63_11068 [Murinocardiopsis flavida]
MSYTIDVIGGGSIGESGFLGVLGAAGAERNPDEWTSGQWQDGDKTVWFFYDPDFPTPGHLEDHGAELTEALGEPPGFLVSLQVSRTPGSEEFAVRFIAAMAAKYGIVVRGQRELLRPAEVAERWAHHRDRLGVFG